MVLVEITEQLILAVSDMQYEEMLLKAGALLAAVGKVTTLPKSCSLSPVAFEVEVED
jgi:hypothetical protein